MFRTPRKAPLAGVSPQKVQLEKPQDKVLLGSPLHGQHSGLAKHGLGILWAFVMLPVAAYAQQDVSKFDPVDHYGTRLLAGLMVVGFGIVLYSLIRYRGNTSGAVSWGLLALGAGIIPLFVSSAGGLLVVEKSQRVGLCNSCHLTMKPYVDDMKNPKSTSLAALHYKNRYIPDNQCYTCHTSYGMFGTLQAKKEGVIDVFKYYTHTFSVPVKMRHPYSNNDCLKCHGESQKFLATHKKDREAMFADEVSCSQCHDDDNPAHNVGSL